MHLRISLSFTELWENIRFTIKNISSMRHLLHLKPKFVVTFIFSIKGFANFIIRKYHVLCLKEIYHYHCIAPNVEGKVIPILLILLEKLRVYSQVMKRLRFWICTVLFKALVWICSTIYDKVFQIYLAFARMLHMHVEFYTLIFGQSMR